MTTTADSPPGDEELAGIEKMAVTLAELAGARIRIALGRSLGVRYKTASGIGSETQFRDPVSEVDDEVEALIRGQVGLSYPDHDVLGEESADRPARGSDMVWAVDPIDGTANFVNGFPLFAASIGVLWRGAPVVGAIWCSTGHALRPGVYHARRGGRLRFDFEAIDLAPNPEVRRRLGCAGTLEAAGALDGWEFRKTGSAALECAFAAAGLIEVARVETPNIWDVAAGAALLQAAGLPVRVRGADGWQPLRSFGQGEDPSFDLRGWNRPMIFGAEDAVAELVSRGAQDRPAASRGPDGPGVPGE